MTKRHVKWTAGAYAALLVAGATTEVRADCCGSNDNQALCCGPCCEGGHDWCSAGPCS